MIFFLWPGLRVISCWCDANASPYAKQLHQLFPHSLIQPKGLLATECIVSFPLAGKKGAILSIHSHFFEFRSLEDGKLYLAHQLRKNISYEVIVTTGGGLYRYELHDIIQVTGFTGGIPRLRFCGKNDTISDLFGEKLHEVFVAQVLQNCGLRGEFALMAPETDRYVLYAHGGNLPDPERLDTLLRKNFHYDYCRKLGQLKSPRIYRLTGNSQQEYFQRCMERGKSWVTSSLCCWPPAAVGQITSQGDSPTKKTRKARSANEDCVAGASWSHAPPRRQLWQIAALRAPYSDDLSCSGA